MIKKMVLFAGTSEGRELAELCADSGIEVMVCVATAYGEKLIPQHPGVNVHKGRMDEDEMHSFLQMHAPELVVDATHPYAKVVSETVKNVCDGLQLEYVRLLRASSEAAISDERLCWVDDAYSAAKLAERMEGNIFLATGSKELAVFADLVSDFSRLYARVLSTADTFEICGRLGFEGKQLICMQGPFSEELNRAMYAHVNAKILVTKESGDAGGFLAKIQAALALGMRCIVIRRPREQGLSFAAVCARLGISQRADNENPLDEREESRELFLVGIGMGTPEYLTVEACHALEKVQVIFGAERMLKAAAEFSAEKVCEYRSAEIHTYLNRHPYITRAAVVLSGDVGFYSGAAKLAEEFRCAGWQVRQVCGISSVNYFAARLGVPWQDIKLCSVHGRETNLLAQIRRYEKVFSLFSDGAQLSDVARQLSEKELAQVTIAAGFDLGYETEEIWRGSLQEFSARPIREGLCVALFENPKAGKLTTGNLPDAAFCRGAVPLTKEEIRAVAISKLRLCRDAVCYDIGAGTGGMTMDIARYVPDGKVFAFEKNPAACELIRENERMLSDGQVQLVAGNAPECMERCEPPTHAFIGGSGGRLRRILELLLHKNPALRVVLNAITLETVSEAVTLLKTLPVTDVEIVSVTAAKAKRAGAYHLMEGMNPVYIISFTGAPENLQETGADER